MAVGNNEIIIQDTSERKTGERASVIISADITGLTEGIDAIIAALFSIGGVERAGLLDVE